MYRKFGIFTSIEHFFLKKKEKKRKNLSGNSLFFRLDSITYPGSSIARKNRCDRSIRNIADDRDISSIEAKGKVAKGI